MKIHDTTHGTTGTVRDGRTPPSGWVEVKPAAAKAASVKGK